MACFWCNDTKPTHEDCQEREAGLKEAQATRMRVMLKADRDVRFAIWDRERTRRAIAALELVGTGRYPNNSERLKSIFGPTAEVVSIVALLHEYELTKDPAKKSEIEARLVAMDAMLESAPAGEWWTMVDAVQSDVLEDALKRADVYLAGSNLTHAVSNRTITP